MSRSVAILGALALVAVVGGVAVAGHSGGVGEWDLGLSPEGVTVAYSDEVTWTGSLTCEDDDGSAEVDDCPSVEGETVVVAYSQAGAGSWSPVGSATTGGDGSWSLVWQVDVTAGAYDVRAHHGDGEDGAAVVVSGLASLTVTKEDTTAGYTGALEGQPDGDLAVSATVSDHDGTRVSDNPPSGIVVFDLRDGEDVVASIGVALTAGDGSSTASTTLSLEGLEEGTYTLVVTYLGDGFYNGSSVEAVLTVAPEEEEDDSEGRAAPAWANWHIKQEGYTHESCFPDGTNKRNRNWRGVILSQVAQHPDFTGRLFTEATAEVVFEFVDELCAQNEAPVEAGAAAGSPDGGRGDGKGGPPPHAGGRGREG